MINKITLSGKIIRGLGLTFWMLITIFPLYWLIITSLKSPGDIAKYPVQYWPANISFENYEEILLFQPFQQFLFNSAIIAVIAGIMATIIALLSAYVMSRFEFHGKMTLLLAFLVTQMIPAFIALGPLFRMMVMFGLSDSRGGLTLVYVAMCIPFSTIMLRGFFDGVPDAIEEAALVDGCNRITALWRIITPVLMPGIIATFIFNFVNCWNELFLSVTLLSTEDYLTVPSALNSFVSSFNIEWGPMSAAAVLAVLPTMVLFAVASRFIIQGLTNGAVK